MFDIKINGKRVRQYVHGGFTYVEGREGTEYSIEVKNNYCTRKLFVISVDGINVISGKPMQDDPLNGYIVNGYDNLNLRGFRINDQDVAAFKFVKSSQSYAKNVTGSDVNAGVIGVKVYEEKVVLPISYIQNTRQVEPDFPSWPSKQPLWSSASISSIGSPLRSFNASYSHSAGLPVVNCSVVQEKSADFNLGTGWGTKQTQAVKEVSFEVGNLIYTEIIYYASRKQLEDMGVDLGDKPKIRTVMPSAFGEKKYCPVPSGWRG